MEATPRPPAGTPGASPQGPTATSEETQKYIREMQEACARYDIQTDDGRRKVRDFLARLTPEERERYARRILIDLMQGITAGSDAPDTPDGLRK